MEEVVADVVATKLPFFRRNAYSFLGSGEVERAAMQLSKDLTLIFDTTLEEPEVDDLSTSAEEADIPESDSATAVTTKQWFMKLMGALTRATTDSGSSNALPYYLGCSAGASGRKGMGEILAPLLELFQLSDTPPPETRHVMFGIAQTQGQSQLASENPDIVEPALGLPYNTQVQPPLKRRAVVFEDVEPVRKRMKRFPQSDKLPPKCPIKDCELEWKVKGRNSLM